MLYAVHRRHAAHRHGPHDTFAAAVDIALHPGQSVGTIFGLVVPAAPFQPTLAVAPADWTMVINYNGGVIANSGGTNGVAIDAVGNAWVSAGANTHDPVTQGPLPVDMGLVEISPSGAFLSGPTGFVSSINGYSGPITYPQGVAIDLSGSILVGDQFHLTRFSPNGSFTYLPDPNHCLQSLVGVAVAPDNSIWVANFQKFCNVNSAGVLVAGSFDAPQNHEPVAIALDTNVAWGINFTGGLNDNSTMIRITGSTAQPVAPSQAPIGIAVDGHGNVFIAGYPGVISLDRFGTQSPNLFSFTGSTNGSSVVVDGLNHVWVTTFDGSFSTNGRLFEFDTNLQPLSPAEGYRASNLLPVLPVNPVNPAIDGTGNLWVAGGYILPGDTGGSTSGTSYPKSSASPPRSSLRRPWRSLAESSAYAHKSGAQHNRTTLRHSSRSKAGDLGTCRVS